MAELQYTLLTSESTDFDCGNPAINEYVEHSYAATLSQQCYAYKIVYKSHVVGYYMITLRDVALSYCISDISDYQESDFGEFLPSLYINYLAVGQKFQRNKIGTKTLEKIINETRKMTNVLPIRFITINAVPDKIEWYKKVGFNEMGKDIDNVNKYMYIDLIRDKQKLVDYYNESLRQFIQESKGESK